MADPKDAERLANLYKLYEHEVSWSGEGTISFLLRMLAERAGREEDLSIEQRIRSGEAP